MGELGDVMSRLRKTRTGKHARSKIQRPLTIRELAERAGVSESIVSRMENKDRLIGWSTVLKILSALEATPEEIEEARLALDADWRRDV